MSILSKEAADMIAQVLGSDAVPQAVKDAVIQRYQTPGTKQTALRAQFDIVKDGTQAGAARRQALINIIEVAKHGDI